MQANLVSEKVTKIVRLLEKEQLRIDEKIAACKAAGELYQQVLVTEMAILSMQKGFEDIHGGKE